MEEKTQSKKSVRKRAEQIKPFRCKNLIAVIENPTDVKNIGTVIRNANALGVEKVYVVDLAKRSGSAIVPSKEAICASASRCSG